MKTINVVPDVPEWLTSADAARFLGKNVRTVQEWAKEGRISTKPAGNKKSPHQRLYSGADIAALIGNPPPEQRGGARNKGTEIQRIKTSQTERALDTVSIVGTLAINHKSEMEMIVSQMSRNFENLLNVVLTSQKAENDANRERLKAEREDRRERWEMERQDRLERRKNTLKAKAASVN